MATSRAFEDLSTSGQAMLLHPKPQWRVGKQICGQWFKIRAFRTTSNHTCDQPRAPWQSELRMIHVYRSAGHEREDRGKRSRLDCERMKTVMENRVGTGVLLVLDAHHRDGCPSSWISALLLRCYCIAMYLD